MEDSEKQIQTLINSRTTYVGHVTKVSNQINDLIKNCVHYKKLDCLQDQLMSLSEKIKGTHNQILELVQLQISTKLVRSITSMKTLK